MADAITNPELYPELNPILQNGQWNKGGLASLGNNALGYVDPWQAYHEGVDLGNGQVWFANPGNERIGTADVGYGFATAPGQKIASVTSPGTSADANYDWIGQHVKQGIQNNGQTGFTVAKEDIPYLYGAMTQTGRDNTKYAVKQKGLGGLGGLLGMALAAWNPLGLGLIGSGALGGAVGGGLASGNLKGALTGGALGALGGGIGNYMQSGSFLGNSLSPGALNSLSEINLGDLYKGSDFLNSGLLDTVDLNGLYKGSDFLNGASDLSEVDLNSLYRGSNYLSDPNWIDPVDELTVTANNEPFTWKDVPTSVAELNLSDAELTKLASAGIDPTKLATMLPNLDGGILSTIKNVLNYKPLADLGIDATAGGMLGILAKYLESRQGAINNAKSLQNARAAQHSAAFSKGLSPTSWSIPTPRSLDSVTFKGYADGGSVLPDYEALINSAYGNIDRSGNQIDKAGHDYWLDMLMSGKLNLNDFQSTFTRAALENKDPGALSDLVTDAYGTIHRSGFGNSANNIDQPGFDYWMNQLKSGTLNQSTFMPAFNAAATKNMEPTTTHGSPQTNLNPVQISPLQSLTAGQVTATPNAAWAAVTHPAPSSPAALPATADRNYVGFQRFAAGGDVGCPKCGGLAAAAGYLRGGSPGQADDVPIQASHGEYVVDADTVAALGDGNNEAGASALDQMRMNIRRHKRSAPATKIPPKAKRPEAYLPKKR